MVFGLILDVGNRVVERRDAEAERAVALLPLKRLASSKRFMNPLR